MKNSTIISGITLQDLKRCAAEGDFDWEAECVPVLDELIVSVILNTDIKCVCKLALGKVLGSSKKRQAGWRQG